MDGWVSLHRKLLDSIVFSNPKLLKVWIWCLLKATHTEHTQMVGLVKVELKKGDFITGRFKGAEELNLNPNTFYKYLKVLEGEKQIELISNNKFTVVSVINWEVYQNEEIKNNNKITTKEQQNNTNNKGNKGNKKDIKDTSKTFIKFNEDTIEYQLSELLYKKILLNDSKAKTPNLYKWAEHIDKLIRLDNRNIQEIKRVIEYATNDSFWCSNILSTKKLREKFQQLLINASKGGNDGKFKGYSGENNKTEKKWNVDHLINKA